MRRCKQRPGTKCPEDISSTWGLMFQPHTRLAVWVPTEWSGGFLGGETGYPCVVRGPSTVDCSKVCGSRSSATRVHGAWMG